MSLFLRVILDGGTASFLVLFDLCISAAFYCLATIYPLFRAVRERGRMRSICIMLSASAGADLASELASAIYGSKPSAHDIADATSAIGPAVLMFLIAPSLAAIFAITAKKRWGAYLYLAMASLSVVARAADPDRTITAVYLLDALGLALDGALLGVFLLARADVASREQISAIF